MFPLANYVINYDYIVEELCEQKDIKDNTCQGKCHLTKEIQKQAELPIEKTQLIKIDYLKIPHTFCMILNKEGIDTNKLKFLQKLSKKEIIAFIKPTIPPPKYV